MTDAELPAFMQAFDDVRRIFPLRGEDDELRHVGASYFKAMRRFPLPAVRAGADAWLQKGERFPKPAQWIESIPKRRVTPELHALSADDTREYPRVEQLRYEDTPCVCRDCHAAHVTDKPLRFVPEIDADGRDAQALLGERVIVKGHWAHGRELGRWYAAKNAFWAAMFERFGCESPKAQRKLKTTYEQRMKQIFREPVRTEA